ncbi:MAG TPA: PepSY-associated TM helix domain-containing protein [Caulobacteraceae bacterium]|jgi:uncharacterized iron-regulated membrane protein|nr:PepSY-associated TM helix domain-containing protein [Caulobacteraceae bacterium]
MIRTLHKYISLSFVALWILQAVTGVLLVFHWELDDLSLGRASPTFDLAAFGKSIDALRASHAHGTPTGVYSGGGLPGFYDVIVDRPQGHSDVLRVDGVGHILRLRPWDHDYLHVGPFQIATYLHQTLFAHDLGKWIIGLSGMILLSNLILGIKLALPRPGFWRKTLVPKSGKTPAITLFAWHRAVGLWLVVPAFIVISAGVMMAFENPLAGWFDNARPDPPAAVASKEPARATPVGTAEAIATALRLHPGAYMTGVDLPDKDTPWYHVELRTPGEWRRVSGRTYVYVSSRSGRVLADYDAMKMPLRTRFWDGLYAVHAGEGGRWVTRVLAELIGTWLATMLVLGVSLWSARRNPRRTQPNRAKMSA